MVRLTSKSDRGKFSAGNDAILPGPNYFNRRFRPSWLFGTRRAAALSKDP